MTALYVLGPLSAMDVVVSRSAFPPDLVDLHSIAISVLDSTDAQNGHIKRS